MTSSLGLCTLKLVGHVSHFSFVYLSTLGYWNGFTRLRYCIMSSRPCKPCMCGNRVSKHNLKWTF